MLADEQFHDNVRKRIATDHKNAPWAVEDEGQKLIKEFETTRNPYFQARAEDVLDMVNMFTDIADEPFCLRFLVHHTPSVTIPRS